jgi:hypothetical protein
MHRVWETTSWNNLETLNLSAAACRLCCCSKPRDSTLVCTLKTLREDGQTRRPVQLPSHIRQCHPRKQEPANPKHICTPTSKNNVRQLALLLAGWHRQIRKQHNNGDFFGMSSPLLMQAQVRPNTILSA